MKLLVAILLLPGLSWNGIASAAAPPDSTESTGASLRGTEQPLSRDANAAQWAGRALMWPPRMVIETVTWPVQQLAVAHEVSPAFRRVVDVAIGGVQAGPVRLEAFANYHSGEPFAEIGLKATHEPWLDRGGRLQLKAGWLDERRNVFAARLRTPERKLRLEVQALYDNKPERNFYGIGPNSPELESLTDRQRAVIETGLRWQPTSTWGVGLVGYGRSIRLRDPESMTEDQISLRFPEDYLRARRANYGGVELELGYDSRDRGAHSHGGQLLRAVGGGNWSASGADSDYAHASLEAQAFVDLFDRSRILALRSYAAGIRAADPSRLPFTELERAGGRQGPRGYANDRFTDRRQIVLTAEYRYRATQMVQGVLFVDWGAVSPTWETLRLANHRPSFGFGLDLGRRGIASLQVAFSDEGVQFSFGSETIFSDRTRRVR